MELSSLLRDSFRETDQKLLSWLQSELRSLPSQHHCIFCICSARAFMPATTWVSATLVIWTRTGWLLCISGRVY